jgi:hypothetical protein
MERMIKYASRFEYVQRQTNWAILGSVVVVLQRESYDIDLLNGTLASCLDVFFTGMIYTLSGIEFRPGVSVIDMIKSMARAMFPTALVRHIAAIKRWMHMCHQSASFPDVDPHYLVEFMWNGVITNFDTRGRTLMRIILSLLADATQYKTLYERVSSDVLIAIQETWSRTTDTADVGRIVLSYVDDPDTSAYWHPTVKEIYSTVEVLCS